MKEGGDKMATNVQSCSVTRSRKDSSKVRKKQDPFLKVKFGSAAVPIYRTETNGRIRFTLSFYRELAIHHLQALPRTDHRGGSGKVVRNPAK
jgi:hypothetical protein